MGNNTIEAQVTLGLSGVIAQANQLKQIVNESVKPDSSAYQEILGIINKIGNAADNLKGKMADAFKTSSGTKSFLKDYEKLISMLTVAKAKFGNVGLEGLKLSTEEQESVDGMLNRLRELQKEIEIVNKGKIGKIFDDSSAAGADKVREIISNLGGEIDKITFSKLSSEIRKETANVNSEIESIDQRITNLNTLLGSLSGDKLTSFTDKIQNALDMATTKTTFKSENLFQYTEALKNFYAQYEGYAGKQGNVKTGGDIQKFIEQECNSIRDGIVKVREQIPQYKAALEELKSLYKMPKGGSAAEQKARADEIGQRFGIFGDANEVNWLKYIKSIEGQFNDAIKTADLGEQMLANIKNVFDGIDVNKVISPDKLRAQLKTIFTEAFGKDILEDTNIQNIFNSITKDMDFGQFIQSVRTGLDSYANNLRTQIENLNISLDDLKNKKSELGAADGLVSSSAEGEAERVRQLLSAIEELNGSLGQFVEKKQKANETKLEVPGANDNLNQAKSSLESYIESLSKLEHRQQALSNVKMAVDRWMGFWQVLNLTKRAVNDMKQHVQELDQVMTKIAVVTNMSQSDLWGQIGKYSEIARQYGVAIKGVYEVSQIYYQQGLQQGDVMTLTQETLKMARIAGIDYSTAADYMTTAIRGFKLEMTDAAHVTDVFSNLAAHTASSTEELATAISKTAASAASVGSSFESTSAMMATMIATTRESATNIGTALKSIIARYGEMKENVTGIDDEGEEYSLNKVDKALQTIGVSIHDATGQFRDFDDVILELAEHWDTIDTNTQRYIATVMAGNRQQSRFLALVSNVEEYKRALELANNADNAGELQTLKTLDSVDAKIEQMKVTVQEFYTSSGIENLYKGILDTITNVISAANDLPKVFGNFPTTAIAVGLQVVNAIKNILKLIIASVQTSLETIKTSGKNLFTTVISDSGQAGTIAGRSFVERFRAEMQKLNAAGVTGFSAFLNTSAGRMAGLYASSALSTGAAMLSMNAMSQYGSSMSRSEDQAAGHNMGISALLNAGSGFLSGTLMSGSPLVGALSAIVSFLPSAISAISMHNVTLERQIELDEKNIQEAKSKQVKAQGKVDELSSARDKLITLQEAASSSSESLKEFTDYQNQLGDSYPLLVAKMDEVGNKTIDLAALEDELASARTNAARATVESIEREENLANDQKEAYEQLRENLDMAHVALNGENGMDSSVPLAKNKLKESIESLNRQIPDANILKLFDFESYSNIEEPKSLEDLIVRIDTWAQERINQIDKSQLTRSKSKTYSTALVEVDKQFELLDNETRNKYLDRGYDTFITKMISRLYDNDYYNENGGIDFSDVKNADIFKAQYDSWLEWATSHADAVKWLQESFNIEDYRSKDKLREALAAEGKGELSNKIIVDSYAKEWTSTFDKIRDQYTKGITDNLDRYQEQFTKLFDEKVTDDNVKSEFIPQLQSAFKQYKDLQKQGYKVLARNYLLGVGQIYTQIGKLEPEYQDEAYSILKDLDIADTDSLDSAIEALSSLELKDKYKTLISVLTKARNRIADNVEAMYLQLAESAPELAESTDKFFKNFGKGLEYSEALKKAQEIIDKSEAKDRIATDLIKFDSDIGKWDLTLDATTEGYNQLVKSYSDGLVEASDKTSAQIALLQSYIDNYRSNADFDNVTFTSATGDIVKMGDRKESIESFNAKLQTWEQDAESQHIDVVEYLQQQLDKLKSLQEIQGPALERILAALPLTVLTSFNWNEFADGTITKEKGTELLTFYLSQLGIEANEFTENIITDLLKGNFGSFELLLKKHGYENIISKATKTDVKKSNIEQYTNAIDQLTSVGSIITDKTMGAAAELGISITGIKAGSEQAIAAAKQFLDTLAASIGEAGYALSDYNANAKAILEASLFNNGGKNGVALDFATGDITTDSLESLANSFGRRLTSIIDVTSGEVLGALQGHLSYNTLTNKYEIQGSFDSFILALEAQFGVAISRTSTEYLDALNDFNEAQINKTNKFSEEIYNEIKSLAEAKPNTKVSVAYLSTLGEDVLNASLEGMHASLENGVLSLSQNANIPGIINALSNAAAKAGQLIPDQIAELADSIAKILQEIGDLITNGIKGSLSNVDKNNLQNLASTQLGITLTEADFTKTADGFKLAQESATALYYQLKQIDAFQAKLVFDELNSSLTSTDEHYRSISDIMNRIAWIESETHPERSQQYAQELALAKEILAVRSTTEDSSFNFMSNSIPGAQNNPINYFNNWAKAIKGFNDALKNKERGSYTRDGETIQSGFIDYQDWYNMITEMNNLASESHKITFAGQELDGSLEAAAKLIEKGAASLVATNTGEIKVALSGMELDFEAGADAFSSGVTQGIQSLAKSQVKMLDGMIQLLETVVAMEKLGDITGANDTIDIIDLFPVINWQEGEERQINNQKAIDWLNNVLIPADPDSDLGKALDNILINSTSLRNWAKKAVSSGLTKEEATNFTSVINSLYKMYTSGEYNLDDLYGSIQQVMGSSNFEGTIELGDSILHIKKGSMVIETEDGNYETPGGESYDNLDEALAMAAFESIGSTNAVYHADGTAYGTIEVDGATVNVNRDKEGNMKFTGAGVEGNSLTEYVENLIAHEPAETRAQKAVRVKLETGAIKLDSVSYKAVDEQLRQELESALSKGDVIEVNRIINENAIFSQLRGLSAEEIANALGIDINLGDIITKGITNAIPDIVSALNDISADGPKEVASALSSMLSVLQELQAVDYSKIAQGLAQLKAPNGSIEGEDSFGGMNLSVLFEGISNPFKAIADTLDGIKASKVEALKEAANGIIPAKAVSAKNAINTINPGPAQAAKSALNNISITGKTVQAIANIIVRVQHGGGSNAKGNVALAAGTPTLMGELGPELVVSNGHYFVVGQAGAEFVNLEKDAIVFNHKQTERLMSSGSIGSRGKPFTNEQNAISYAKGNVEGPANSGGKDVPWKTGWTYNYQVITSNGGVSGHLWNAPIAEIELPAAAKGTGPAMASASAALAALKQLRAQWNALAGLSAQDLAGKGGGGGGGGGDPKAFLKDLERWYDWLQQIAQLEKEINQEEAKRNEYQSNLIAHGKEYYTSQVATLDKLRQQIAVERSLLNSQQAYFDKRRKELNQQSAFSALYGFSETGQLYYKDIYGDKSAFEWLSDLAGRNEVTGEANYTAEEQYKQLVAAGFEQFMQYDSSGNQIKKEGNEWYATAVQAFWDKIDADKEEMQSLHDSIMEHEQATVEAQNSANEILQAIRDNQIDLEKDVLKAVEEIKQRAIDNLKDEKDAIKESTDALVDGLNEQMQREQQMYQNQQNQNEVTKIQRQLSILQRSGGSASEIANLQKQLSDKQKDMYFDVQQQQIDAIKDAADRQIEKLEKQIELMEETLAYEKEHGMLWQEVYAVMSESPEYIAEFIMKNTKEYWGQSATEYEKSFTEELFKAQQWGEFRENAGNIYDLLNKYLNPEEAEAPTVSDEEIGGNTGASAPAPAASGGGDGGGKGKTPKAEYIYEKIDDTYHMKKKLQSNGTYKDVGKEKHRYNNGRCVCGADSINYAKGPISDSYANTIVDNSAKAAQTQTKTVITPQSTLKPVTWTTANTLLDTLNKLKIQKKASGGYTGHGLYEIGEQGTEAIFTAEQTQVLRENILSDRPSSLISLLKSYNEAYRGLSQSTYDSISDNSNSVTIERAEVNMNVTKIADDYDAQRAGEEALSKMLEIARKTTANNRIGR